MNFTIKKAGNGYILFYGPGMDNKCYINSEAPVNEKIILEILEKAYTAGQLAKAEQIRKVLYIK